MRFSITNAPDVRLVFERLSNGTCLAEIIVSKLLLEQKRVSYFRTYAHLNVCLNIMNDSKVRHRTKLSWIHPELMGVYTKCCISIHHSSKVPVNFVVNINHNKSGLSFIRAFC